MLDTKTTKTTTTTIGRSCTNSEIDPSTNSDSRSLKKDENDEILLDDPCNTISDKNNIIRRNDHHKCVVLFYKYFIPKTKYRWFHENAKTIVGNHNDNDDLHDDDIVQKLVLFLEKLCKQLQMKGRILIAKEGINGTLSAKTRSILHQFIDTMETLNIRRHFLNNTNKNMEQHEQNDDIGKILLGDDNDNKEEEYLFANIDWKISDVKNNMVRIPKTTIGNQSCNDDNDEDEDSVTVDPFPDLKVTRVKEVISTGGSIDAEEIVEYGGIHLSPKQFHEALLGTSSSIGSSIDSSISSSCQSNYSSKQQQQQQHPSIVLIDVRNTFEYDIGHFINPSVGQPAINPNTCTFSTFDDLFCKKKLLPSQQQQQSSTSSTTTSSTTTKTIATSLFSQEEQQSRQVQVEKEPTINNNDTTLNELTCCFHNTKQIESRSNNDEHESHSMLKPFVRNDSHNTDNTTSTNTNNKQNTDEHHSIATATVNGNIINEPIEIDYEHTKVLMYCTGGIRCEKASVMLKKRGVKHVYQLSGGIHRYIEQYGSNGLFVGKNFVFDQRIVQNPSDCCLMVPNENDHNNNNNNNQHGGGKEEEEDIGQSSESTTTSTTITKDSVEQQVTNAFIDDPYDNTTTGNANKTNKDDVIVGKCIECHVPYDELCGSRICTVCRDLVLVCPLCQSTLYEYHCRKHSFLKHCYYTFLNGFSITELHQQYNVLHELYTNSMYAYGGNQYKNIRKTLLKQMIKVQQHIHEIDTTNNNNQTSMIRQRRCRTCMETIDICDGRCWGYWKTITKQRTKQYNGNNNNNNKANEENVIIDVLPIQVGDRVEPGPDWNIYKRGPKHLYNSSSTGGGGGGIVIHLKSWDDEYEHHNNSNKNNNSNTNDVAMPKDHSSSLIVGTVQCPGGYDVVVEWNNSNNNNDDENIDANDSMTTTITTATTKKKKKKKKMTTHFPITYRWGILALNGKRMYDLQRIDVSTKNTTTTSRLPL